MGSRKHRPRYRTPSAGLRGLNSSDKLLNFFMLLSQLIGKYKSLGSTEGLKDPLEVIKLVPERCDGFPRWEVHPHSLRMTEIFTYHGA